jgi:hypothetical protein
LTAATTIPPMQHSPISEAPMMSSSLPVPMPLFGATDGGAW